MSAKGSRCLPSRWRNPEQAQGHFDLDTYANAVAQARDAAASITEQRKVHPAAACSGGIVTAGLLGQPVDLQQVDLDTYFVAGLTDHIVPWESACNGARLFGGDRRFVLSSSGHVQALVNPPSAPGDASRASYRVADALPEAAEEFLAQARTLSGSWWSDWESWLAERSGEFKPAPKTLGNRAHKAQAKAPGTYVLAN